MNVMTVMKTVSIREETKKKLDKFIVSKEDTYDDIITRVIKLAEQVNK